MKRILTIIALFFISLSYAQGDSLPDVLIRYSNDNSIFLTGSKKKEYDLVSTSSFILNKQIDSTAKYYAMHSECIPDIAYSNLIKNNVELDSVAFSELLIKSELKMQIIKYEYGGVQNYKSLTEKYGVIFYSGGCIYDPSEFERQCSRIIRRLLAIRNGVDWEVKYNKDIRKIK